MKSLLVAISMVTLVGLSTSAQAHGRHHHGPAKALARALVLGAAHAAKHANRGKHRRHCFWHTHRKHGHLVRHRHCR